MRSCRNSATMLVAMCLAGMAPVTCQAEFRIWTTNDTRLTFKGEFISQDGESVELKFPDGSRTRIPLRRLVSEDREHIRVLTNATSRRSDAESSDIRERRYVDLPALTVLTERRPARDGRPYEYQGHINPIRMEFRDSDDETQPFRLSIAEELPDAAGESLEASFWLAAIVAGLERGDNLAGVDVKFSLSGRVDGPSAGGLVCLALLAALDHQKLPTDFTFSGAVLPDGTIGRVGGLVEKIKASAEAGYKRVIIPNGIRFAEDLNSETLVDLNKLASELNIKLLVANNIREAHAALHGRRSERADSSTFATSIPRPFEKILSTQVQSLLEEGDHVFSALPEDEAKRLLDDTRPSHFITTRAQAESALRAGHFFWAKDKALSWKLSMLAHARTVKHKDSPDYIKAINGDADVLREKTTAPWDVIINLSSELPPIASQTCVEIEESLLLYSVIDNQRANLKTRKGEIEKLPEDQLPDGVTREQLLYHELARAGYVNLFLSHILKDYHENFPAEQHNLSNHMTDIAVDSNQARSAERFFYTAYHTALNTLLSDVMADLAEYTEMSRPEAIDYAISMDEDLYDHVGNDWGLSRNAHRWHRYLSDDSLSDTQRDFITTYSAHLYANYFADISSIIVRWGNLDVEFTDEGLQYRRTSELSRMLREARKNAIRNIHDCQYHGIPCPQALYEFQEAEATRDDRDVDPVNVLASYWRASLQSQALKMLYDRPITLTREEIWNSNEMKKATQWVATYLRRNKNYDEARVSEWKKELQLLSPPQMTQWLKRYQTERRSARKGDGFNLENINQ